MQKDTTKKESIKKRIKELQSKAAEEQADLLTQLEEIEADEKKKRDEEKLKKAVDVLNNGKLFLSLISHTRTSCSDDSVSNGHTTPGRGGSLRCARCGFINALNQWEQNKAYATDMIACGEYSYEELADDIGLYIEVSTGNGLEINLYAESTDW